MVGLRLIATKCSANNTVCVQVRDADLLRVVLIQHMQHTTHGRHGDVVSVSPKRLRISGPLRPIVHVNCGRVRHCRHQQCDKSIYRPRRRALLRLYDAVELLKKSLNPKLKHTFVVNGLHYDVSRPSQKLAFWVQEKTKFLKGAAMAFWAASSLSLRSEGGLRPRLLTTYVS